MLYEKFLLCQYNLVEFFYLCSSLRSDSLLARTFAIAHVYGQICIKIGVNT